MIFSQVTEITTSCIVRLAIPDKYREAVRILFGISRGLPDKFECNDLRTASRLFSAEWEKELMSKETLRRRASTRISGLERWQIETEKHVIEIDRGTQTARRDDAGYPILDNRGNRILDSRPTVYSMAPFLAILTGVKNDIENQARNKSQVFDVVDRQIMVQFGKLPDTREKKRPPNPEINFQTRDKGMRTGLKHLADACERELNGNGDKYLADFQTWISELRADRISRGKRKWQD
jgi:hypothetical protein